MTIQETLGAFLATQGQHEAGAAAYEATTRKQWLELAELAVRTAPAEERLNVAWRLATELSKPENGGGVATAYLRRLEALHKLPQ